MPLDYVKGLPPSMSGLIIDRAEPSRCAGPAGIAPYRRLQLYPEWLLFYGNNFRDTAIRTKAKRLAQACVHSYGAGTGAASQCDQLTHSAVTTARPPVTDAR